jgi:hypothetical protein
MSPVKDRLVYACRSQPGPEDIFVLWKVIWKKEAIDIFEEA